MSRLNTSGRRIFDGEGIYQYTEGGGNGRRRSGTSGSESRQARVRAAAAASRRARRQNAADQRQVLSASQGYN